MMLTYMVSVKPFTSKILNALEMSNEITVLVTGYLLILFTAFNSDSTIRGLAGYVYIAAVISCILLNWGVIAFKLIQSV